MLRSRESRLSAPTSNMSLLHSSSRSVMGDPALAAARPSRRDTLSSPRAIGHTNYEENFLVYGHRPRSQYGTRYGPQYRLFQDSSFSDTPSIDTISTYLSHETRDYRYGYASQNGSFYSGSVGSQELIDMYGDEDSVFTDDR